VNSIDKYAEAVIAHRNGNAELAAKHLASALGVEKPTREISENINLLLNPDKPIHEAMTRLVRRSNA
jgi:hypothetical protein